MPRNSFVVRSLKEVAMRSNRTFLDNRSLIVEFNSTGDHLIGGVWAYTPRPPCGLPGERREALPSPALAGEGAEPTGRREAPPDGKLREAAGGSLRESHC